MKSIKCFVLLLAIGIAPSLYGQENKPFSFTGTWINVQLEDYTNKQKDERILSNITPQYLLIDSGNKCTVIIRFEQKSEFGKPVSKRNFANRLQLTFKGKYIIYLTQMPEDPNLIVMTFGNSS